MWNEQEETGPSIDPDLSEAQDLGVSLTLQFLEQEIPAALGATLQIDLDTKWKTLLASKIQPLEPEQQQEFWLALNTYAISQVGPKALQTLLPEANKKTAYQDLQVHAETVIGQAGAMMLTINLRDFLDKKLTLTGIDAERIMKL